MDFSDYEGANIIQDLNTLIKNHDIFEKYDLIIDGGTLEHVFHVPNAFENFFKLLKIGGQFYILHQVQIMWTTDFICFLQLYFMIITLLMTT